MYFKKTDLSWYAIYTKPNREKKVIDNLKEDGIECYLPLLKTLRQWSDRKKWVEEPLFRGYAFVRVSNIEFFKVLDVPGVVCYIKFGGIPQTIPDYQIENIKTFVKQEQKEVVLTREKVAKGVQAKVLHGPLKGVTGEIVQICGQSRILIRMEAMGCCLYANISKDEIKLVEPEVRQTRNTIYKPVRQSKSKSINSRLAASKRRVVL